MAKYGGLVLDGGEVKFRLEAERQASSNLIHIDWLRFTVFLRNVVPTFETLPDWDVNASSKFERELSKIKFASEEYYGLNPNESYVKHGATLCPDGSDRLAAIVIKSTLDGFEAERKDTQFQGACSEAFDLAREVAQILGKEFAVNTTLKPGQDFYKYRFCIERNGFECAWVGFLAAGNGKSKGSQDQTIHVNIQGHACTFAEHGWREKMADCIDTHKGRITRADLALDVFTGLGYDFGRLLTDYKQGVFKVRGKNPACKLDGDWGNDSGRSIYIGSRTSGKITNIYEKGDQLFGVKACSPWVRAELRYGDQERVLPSDLLRRPDSFFSGASDWHEALLVQVGASVVSQSIKTVPTLEKQTVVAEVYRNLVWLRDSAASTMRGALKFMDYDTLLEFLLPDSTKLPGRLEKFKTSELSSAYQSVVDSFKAVGGVPAPLLLSA
jgi:phage replication initiation protein